MPGSQILKARKGLYYTLRGQRAVLSSIELSIPPSSGWRDRGEMGIPPLNDEAGKSLWSSRLVKLARSCEQGVYIVNTNPSCLQTPVILPFAKYLKQEKPYPPQHPFQTPTVPLSLLPNCNSMLSMADAAATPWRQSCCPLLLPATPTSLE